MLIRYLVPMFSGFMVFTRPYEYFRKYSNREEEIALVERLYGAKPARYKVLKITPEEYLETHKYEKDLAALRLAKHVGATKIESGKHEVGEA